MSLPSAFWDASALVPLCVEESATRQVRSYLRRSVPVVWWGSAVEVHSAITRLYRSGVLTDIEKQGAIARLQLLGQGWKEILPVDAVREQAQVLLDLYPLRAADSLQLAAALTWCQKAPSGRKFIAGDQRLCDAAESAGFEVVRLF